MYNTSGRVDTDIVACTGRGGEGKEGGRGRGTIEEKGEWKEGKGKKNVKNRRRAGGGKK